MRIKFLKSPAARSARAMATDAGNLILRRRNAIAAGVTARELGSELSHASRQSDGVVRADSTWTALSWCHRFAFVQ